MRTKALVAARAGSMRVKSKNTRPFAGTTLLEIKLRQLLRIPSLDGVIVNSEDREILDIAERLGCEAVVRSEEFASNDVLMSDVYAHMATNCDADVLVYANCTSPLIRDRTIAAFIEEFHAGEAQFDSLNSAAAVREFLFQDGRPVNYDLMSQPRSQDLPDIRALTFAVNVIARETMISCRNVVGTRPKLKLTDEVESCDIDTPLDFSWAEHLYATMGGDDFLMS